MKVEVSDIKTKGNLTEVRSIFEALEMNEQLALIDKDLARFSKLD
jgi:hypothetical protein